MVCADVKLRDLCGEYIKWIYGSIEGLGYIADKNREEAHRQIAEHKGVKPEELNYILHNLDKWIDMKLEPRDDGVVGYVGCYGYELYLTLLILPDPLAMPNKITEETHD